MGKCHSTNAFLALLFLICICFGRGHKTRRLAGLSEAGINRAESELCPDSSLSPLTVFIGLKTTTATAVYTARTRLIMSAWGSHTLGNLALITDGLSPKHNADLIGQYSNLPIIEMIGSEKFGMYRQGVAHRHIGYASQRIKVRSLVKWFFTSVRPESGIQWLCYIDDDMYVNPNSLNDALASVLAAPPPTCSRLDRCVVADVGGINVTGVGEVRYSNAIWCMTMSTVAAVNDMLESKTDAQLGWDGDDGSDDVGFALMMKRGLNITFTDSLSMFSINNRVVVSPEGRKVNPVGSYTIRKANIRGDPAEWNRLTDIKAASDVLSRISVLNLPHVNYTDLYERHGAHKIAYGTSPRLIVDMKQWNAYVSPRIPCRQPLNQTLRIAPGSPSSFIVKFK